MSKSERVRVLPDINDVVQDYLNILNEPGNEKLKKAVTQMLKFENRPGTRVNYDVRLLEKAEDLLEEMESLGYDEGEVKKALYEVLKPKLPTVQTLSDAEVREAIAEGDRRFDKTQDGKGLEVKKTLRSGMQGVRDQIERVNEGVTIDFLRVGPDTQMSFRKPDGGVEHYEVKMHNKDQKVITLEPVLGGANRTIRYRSPGVLADSTVGLIDVDYEAPVLEKKRPGEQTGQVLEDAAQAALGEAHGYNWDEAYHEKAEEAAGRRAKKDAAKKKKLEEMRKAALGK